MHPRHKLHAVQFPTARSTRFDTARPSRSPVSSGVRPRGNLDRRVLAVVLHEEVGGARRCPSDRFDDLPVLFLMERLDTGGAHVAERSDPEDESGRRRVVRKLGDGDKVISAHR